ncbi:MULTISPECIES: hypothetical protein [unclassified Duganella]|uniref:hypothetical protein n=1 Tax=unclassified Duganella TaxID=2636909 RepID=UPI000E34B3CE|nr:MULTISPECIES: hypothetical protein [unclassified Duganella]RFP19045.1 hypothetical protein D0T23_04475 [Duganella sp. BJB475]RFP35707.1 hypothetical protein D0T21_04475 [Duganella sp. BJB476]
MSRRWTFVALLVTVTLLASYWLGEHNTELVSIDGLLAGLPAAAVLPFMLWSWRKWGALLAPFAILFVSIAVWLGGAIEGIYAQNECVGHGEEARVALAKHHASHGRYPASLSELDESLPCKVILPPGVLHYELTSTGYHMWFGDKLVSHDATEGQPFIAHK